MISKRLKSISWVLAIGVLFLLTTGAGGAFVHEVQHAAHHTADMHATGLCAWMCATSGAIISPVFQTAESTVVLHPIVSRENRAFSFTGTPRLQARAPPVLL